MKPPVWFVEFEKRINARFNKIESRIDRQDEFNQYVRNVFKRNNLK